MDARPLLTTVDLDFLFRKTARNLTKLRALADRLDATILRAVHGLRSFEGVRDRATRLEFEGAPLLVAALSDIIRSKRAAGRPQDLAVLPLMGEARESSEAPGREARRRPKRK